MATKIAKNHSLLKECEETLKELIDKHKLDVTIEEDYISMEHFVKASKELLTNVQEFYEYGLSAITSEAINDAQRLNKVMSTFNSNFGL